VRKVFVAVLLILWQVQPAGAQGRAASDSTLERGTLSECIHFALTHQPLVRQSVIDEAITEKTISSKLAEWYPQLNFGFNVQHDPELPTSIVQGNPVKLGLQNTSGGQFVLSQTLFNRDVLLASSTAGEVRRESSEQTVSAKIDVVVNVSKAYYAVLATLEQIDLLDEDIVRLQQSLNDAFNQYKSGVVDKTDYQRATIALNNARAEKLQNEELLKARYASLKNQIGYPASAGLKLEYNVPTMEREAMLDTTQSLNPANRIEYQLFTTHRSLQEANVDYQEWGFLPTVTAYGAYNLSFQNNEFAQLYGRDYPNSNLGLQLSFPIFQGGKRLQEIAAAKLQLERSENDLVALDNSIQAEYASAIAAYKSNLNNYRVLKENLALAKDVYQTIELQYKAGTKTYLDVITAETDLRTAQANETDALYEVLSSKLDVEKALGTVHY
jgi:outer membrane protein